MLHVIEIGSQIQIDDARLLFDNRLGHPVDRCMGCPVRTVSIRPRLEVRFEDRLQDELQRPLDHTIPDSRNRQNADFRASVLRNFLLPDPHGPIRVRDQFVPNLLQKTLRSAFLNGLERDSVYTRRPVVTSRHLVGFPQRLHLADVDVQSPESPSWFSLRLDIYPLPQVLQTNGCVCHSPLLSFLSESLQTAGPLRSTVVTRFTATMGPAETLSPSTNFPVFSGYMASLLRRFLDGTRRFLQLLSMPLSPCCP